MNKTVRITLIILGVLFFLYSIGSVTGILKFYNNSTTANEPNLKLYTKFISSNLVNPKNGDFVCYNYENKMLGKHTRIHKLCGMENDVIEIKNGIVFLNGKNIDDKVNYIHFYQISKPELEELERKGEFSEVNFTDKVDENTVRVTLDDEMANKYGLSSKRVIDEKGKLDEAINAVFKHNWNKDNFGPITIPKGKIFVMGDNRDFSDDSRYIGFINKSDIIGVVISN